MKECNICSKEYKNQHGLSIHKSTVHNLKPVVECTYCGEEKKVNKYVKDNQQEFFCNKTCETRYREETRNGPDNPRWKSKVEKNCSQCDSVVKIYPSELKYKDRFFCDMNCYGDWRSANISMSGEDHPRYTGGSVNHNTPLWKEQRRKARQRDNNMCLVCGKTKEEIGRKPDVHHLKPYREFDSDDKAHRLENLVTLCPTHHKKYEDKPVAKVKKAIEGR